MKTVFRRAVAVLLVVALGPGPLPAPARADEAVAKIKKVVHDDLKEVPYPTKLVQLVTDQSERDASKNMAVAAGEAVLTRSANTFVRFDDLNVWLLRSGALYVVNKRGRLEIVAEALGRVLVGSSVLLRSDGSELFAFVTEGRVVLEAGAHTLSLGPGQAGRIGMGGVPERASLEPEEQARLSKELEATEKAMRGGGSGWLAALVGLAVIGTAVAVTRGGGGDRGGGGGTQALPDLAPVADPAGGPCRFDDRGNLVVTVRNQGQAPAAASTAEVRLRADTRGRTADGPSIARQGLQLRTSALAAGAATDLVVRTGGARIGAYTVTVDRDGRVRESNEANNTADITCPAPVG